MTPPRLAVPTTPGEVVRVRVVRRAASPHRRRLARLSAGGGNGGYVLRVVGPPARGGHRVARAPLGVPHRVPNGGPYRAPAAAR
jgi:hypothetical protein